MATTSTSLPISTRRPKIVISDASLNRLEALAERSFERDPALASRLLDEIGRARIVNAQKMPANVVAIGNVVTYRDGTTGQERTVTLVFPGDADIASQKISIMTPIGVALLGLKEGASFYWDTRDGERRMLTVVRVTSGASVSEN
ncbi:nucleoside diphosphate kinase regulator [Sneathiella sp. CAU 1612]|uniref:Nucleoside diphosphate kinase regulator n=1 Tax=Sneathiella sedimenti TaxID=2816034 RepID=A0ABS3F5Z9_9PROT|nr:nucleoside diphosphate kinase regulator [Sneathiella sedimenti]MBO0333949.1 nucleoside diphosphate kinase regulator [Sneathiella sedimenti]